MQEIKRRRGRPKGAVVKKSATFRLPVDLLRALAALAADQARAQSTLVQWALEAYIDQNSERLARAR